MTRLGRAEIKWGRFRRRHEVRTREDLGSGRVRLGLLFGRWEEFKFGKKRLNVEIRVLTVGIYTDEGGIFWGGDTIHPPPTSWETIKSSPDLGDQWVSINQQRVRILSLADSSSTATIVPLHLGLPRSKDPRTLALVPFSGVRRES
mgnify:CR=1 FL=1|jgi:hypothetical protein